MKALACLLGETVFECGEGDFGAIPLSHAVVARHVFKHFIAADNSELGPRWISQIPEVKNVGLRLHGHFSLIAREHGKANGTLC